MNPNSLILVLYLLILFQSANAKSPCEIKYNNQNNTEPLKFKLGAIIDILTASAAGICIPLLLKKVSAFQPEKPLHFLIKALAAGVILGTAFLHILPDAFESLTSSCIAANPWADFPFAGFIAMMAAIGTLSMETYAMGNHKRAELRKAQPVDVDSGDEERDLDNVTAREVHGVAAAIILERSNSSHLLRHRVVSQILEVGIVVHSVIIGVSLGASQNIKIIKSLMVALGFHQFFEGIGLGACISQARFKKKQVRIMVLFFSLTTPVGIGIGIAISKVYQKNIAMTITIEGVLNSASAGILIYMALVDLLAADFMNPNLQTNFNLQLGTTFALLLGASCMALLARWGGT